MLTAIMWVTADLVNGAMGITTDILFKEKAEDTSLPLVVLVSFVKYNRPTLTNLDRTYCSHKTYVGSKSGLCSRLQLPRLSLAWAITAHKLQGLTLSKAVIDLRKKEFAAGLSFIAISHIHSLAL